MTFKLAVVLSHPIQYQVPVFRALAKKNDVALTVYYCSDHGVSKYQDAGFGVAVKWDIPLLEGYHYQFLPNLSRRPAPNFWGQINPAIVRELWRHRYDGVLIYGYNSVTYLIAFLAAVVARTPILMRGSTHLLDDRPFYVHILKKMFLTPLFKLVSTCLYNGMHNKQYYLNYGVSEDKLVHAHHVVDNDFFLTHYARLQGQEIKMRRQFGIMNDDPVILFTGKLVPKKQPLLLLDVYQELRQKHPCNLLYVGDGGLRSEIESKVSEENIPNVYITGFLNQNQMPQAYVAGDILVLPSSNDETWGLVINEGMNFALPLIISDRVGCGSDLVKVGQNGYIVDSYESLRDALESLIVDHDKRARFGATSSEIIAKWGISECVAGIETGLQIIQEQRNLRKKRKHDN